MKTWLSAALALLLVFCCAAGALASAGDRTILRPSSDPSFGSEIYVESAFVIGRDIYYGDSGSTLCIYNLDTQETRQLTVSHDQPDEDSDADDSDEEDFDDEEFDEEYDGDFSGTSRWTQIDRLFAYDGTIYALAHDTISDEDGSEFEGEYVRKLDIVDDTAYFVPSDIDDLDFSDLVSEGEYVDMDYIERVETVGDTLYLLSQSYETDMTVLHAFDLQTGRHDTYYIDHINSFAPAGEGMVIIQQFDWAEADTATLSLYDLESDSVVSEMTVEVVNYALPSNLCYDAERGMLYFVQNGEIWRCENMDPETLISVNEAPSTNTGAAGALTDDGYMLLYNWQSVVLRSVDPEKRSKVNLKAMLYYGDTNVFNNAYFAFTENHGDMSVVISRGENASDILQAMMNRDSTYDIYSLSASSNEFDTLKRRGFLTELDADAYIAERVDAMWPAFSEAMKDENGSIIAVPTSVYGNALAVNTAHLEQLGLTFEDLPTSWDGILDFMIGLPELLEDNDSLRAFEPWYDQTSIRTQLQFLILRDYQNYLGGLEDESFQFNTPVLQNLLNKVEQIDLEALGVPESDDDEGGWWSEDGQKYTLFSIGYGLTDMYYNADDQPRSLILSIDGEEPKAGVFVTVVIVNPYSEHKEEAMLFLESLLDSMTIESKYNFFPEYDEPMKYPGFEEYAENLKQWYDDAVKSRDEADEDEKAEWDETIEFYQHELENVDDSFWRFSPQMIESYRRDVERFTVVTYDFTNDVSQDPEFETIWTEFISGQSDTQTFLQAIDRKVRMMREEGY
ncbi:MAG: carbohydrate ABC transporter substrate-binding protein [Clostridia bacterium]|nr:carbohydrate ABC transporter substrate-binding protein [Clostridia bacterium]